MAAALAGQLGEGAVCARLQLEHIEGVAVQHGMSLFATPEHPVFRHLFWVLVCLAEQIAQVGKSARHLSVAWPACSRYGIGSRG